MRAPSWLVAGVLLAAAAAGAQPPTPTGTGTWTPVVVFTPTPLSTATRTGTPGPTITGTPLPSARIPVELIQWVTPAPTPPSPPRCFFALRSDVLLPECVPSTLGGAPNFSATVSTVAGEPFVDTTETIPAGATVERCIAETLADVTGGYDLGVAGIAAMYARMTGTAGETSASGTYFVAPHGNYVTSPRRITPRHPSGLFQDNDGEVEISCWYRTY